MGKENGDLEDATQADREEKVKNDLTPMEQRKLECWKEKIEAIVDEQAEEVEAISDFIFRNPELSGEEYLGSAYLAEVMRRHGFSVQERAYGLDTAFRAEKVCGSGQGPVIAFLAEYDALPHMKPESDGSHRAEHTCGHNWIAATAAAAAICLGELSDRFEGKVVLLGTPAEETVGGKVDMIRNGAFRDVDVVFQPHLENFTDIGCTSLALDALEFRFTGRATHAASYPYKGINALDAVHLTFDGVNAMRQQLREDAKICGIVVSGGEMPNIIPDYGVCRFYVRARSRKYLDEVTQWVIDCARGAELMTHARLEYSYFENSFEDILNVDLLQDLIRRNLERQGIRDFCDSEKAPTGSSDVGNVSKVCPTMYFEVDVESEEDFYTHEEVALRYVNAPCAYRKMHQVTKAVCGAAMELFLDPKMVDAVKRRHTELVEKSQK